jgi:hypothetical protein
MPHAKPQWVFTRADNATWAWLSIRKDGALGLSADVFISLDEATADAAKHGFDPFSQYWTARIDGRTTHYRPGKRAKNLKVDETLLD